MFKRLLWLWALSLALSLAPAVLAENSDAFFEKRLEELGYYRQAQDFETALRNFQVANGLLATATVDDSTIAALQAETAVSQQAYLEAFCGKYKDSVLQPGDSGNAVSALQTALKVLGYTTGKSDGVYGTTTQSAVCQFQLANGLYVTGEADACTLLRLYEGSPISWEAFLEQQCALRGESGAQVKRLQERLAHMGYFHGNATGSYGELTQQAVLLFQMENGINPSGDADLSTCRTLYSGTAKVLCEEGALRYGDSGEAVSVAQKRLSALNYLPSEANGTFDDATRNAVLLFQLANGLSATGSVDSATSQHLNSSNAKSMQDAQEIFLETQANLTESDLIGIADAASDLQGQPFNASGHSLFPGFEFVQYVYAMRGVALTDPGAIVQGTSTRIYAPEEIPEGAIVILEENPASGVRMRMGISLGNGRMVYLGNDSCWVVPGKISQIPYTRLYACNFAHEE